MSDLIPLETPLRTGKELINAEVAALEAKDTSLQTQITAEQQARISAVNDHINAAIAHTAQQIADSVPGLSSTNVHALFVELLAKVNTIIAGSSPDKDPELTDIKNLAPGYTPYSTISSPGDVVRDIEKRLIAATWQTFAAKFGWNYLLTDQASPLDYVIGGRTLVNLLGKDGGCESLTPFTVQGTVALATSPTKGGTSSIKCTASSSASYVYRDYNYTLDTAKQYLVAGWVYIDAYSAGQINLRLYDKGDLVTVRYVIGANTATVGSWQFVYAKIPTANVIGTNGFRLVAGLTGTTTATAYIDSLRLYELSTADYNAIGTTYTTSTTPSIDDFIPHVDGVKHLSGAGIRLSGKNLLPPQPDTIHANAALTSPYNLTLNATSNLQYSSFAVPVIKGQTYTMKVDAAGSGLRWNVNRFVNDTTSGNTFGGVQTTAGSVTFSPDVDTVYVNLYSNATGTFTFSNWQLELGSAATAFEPQNNDYAYVDIKLASNVDGSVRDTFDSRLGTVTRWWKTDVAADASQSYAYVSAGTGYKIVRVTSLLNPRGGHDQLTSVLTGPSGHPLRFMGSLASNLTAVDQYLFRSDLGVYIVVDNAASGWGPDYSPSAAEIEAMAIGWKMNNGTFGTAYNGSGTKTWTAINATSNTGAVTTVPTTASAAITSGAYDYYRLSYQLAAPDPQAVVPEGSLSSHNGGNQFEVLSGVIPREKVTPGQGADGVWRVNSSYLSTPTTCYLSRRADVILRIYKNGMIDTSWTIVRSPGTATYYGNVAASCPAALYDPTAEYTVTYQVLDRYALTTNPVDLTLYYNTNLKTVVDSVVRNLSDAETQVSIHDRILADHTARLLALEA